MQIYKSIAIKILSILVLFQCFNLELVDKAGFERFDDFSISKIFRMTWILSIFFLIIYLFNKKIFIRKKNIIFYVYCLFLLVSILASDYGNNLTAYYRWIELLIVSTGLMVLFSYRKKYLPIDIIIQHALSFNFFIIVGVLVFYSIFKPDMVYQIEEQGRARLGGSLYSPNLLGIILIISSFSFLITFKRKIFIFILFLITFVLVYLTNSRTAVFIYLICISFLLWKKDSRYKLLITIILLLLFVFMFDIFEIVTYKNNDLYTLNNRFPIFEVVIKGLKTHLWTGLGYTEGVRYYLYENFTQSFWKPPHTHNAYLETLSSLGIVFGFLVLIYILKLLFFSIITLTKASNPIQKILSIQIIAILLGGFTIPVFGNIINPTFAFLIYIFLTLNNKRFS